MIGELDVLWLRQVGERETWCTDTQEAITAEVAAALGITQGLAASYLEYSRAMRFALKVRGSHNHESTGSSAFADDDSALTLAPPLFSAENRRPLRGRYR